MKAYKGWIAFGLLLILNVLFFMYVLDPVHIHFDDLTAHTLINF